MSGQESESRSRRRGQSLGKAVHDGGELVERSARSSPIKGIAADRLSNFELTESGAHATSIRVVRTLSELRRIVRLSVDDFGTGY